MHGRYNKKPQIWENGKAENTSTTSLLVFIAHMSASIVNISALRKLSCILLLYLCIYPTFLCRAMIQWLRFLCINTKYCITFVKFIIVRALLGFFFFLYGSKVLHLHRLFCQCLCANCCFQVVWPRQTLLPLVRSFQSVFEHLIKH